MADASMAPPTPSPARPWREPLRRLVGWWRTLRWEQPRVRWTAYGLVGLLAMATLGAALLWSGPAGRFDYIEVYIADDPADFEELRICVEDVLVGEGNAALQVLAPDFDLLAYRGTVNPLLLASGYVPHGEYRDVSILFCGARGRIGQEWFDVAIPNRHLRVGSGYDLGASSQGKAAVLIDIDLQESLVLTSRGYEFRPHVSNLYYHDYGTNGGGEKIGRPEGALASNGFTNAPPVTPSTRPTTRAPTFTLPNPRTTTPNEGCGAKCPPGTPAAPPSITSVAGDGEVELTWTVPESPTSPITEYRVYRRAASQEATLHATVEPVAYFLDDDVQNGVTYYYQVSAKNAAGEGPRSAQVAARPTGPPPGPSSGPWDPLGMGEYGCGPTESGAPTLCGVPDPNTTLRWIMRFNLTQLGTAQFQEDLSNQLQPTLAFLQAVRESKQLPAPIDDPTSGLDPVTGTVADLWTVAAMLYQGKWFDGYVETVLHMEPAIVVTMTLERGLEMCRRAFIEHCEVERPVQYGSFSGAKEMVRWNSARATYGYSGAGVGIGVVDSGIDGTHPDLPYRLLPSDTRAVVLRNYKIGVFSMDDLPNTDQHGHGTHVAGIVAGQASLQQGLGVPQPGQIGMAPGAKLYGWGLGNVPTTITAALAYDHILFLLEQDRLDDRVLQPNLRILTNSWGIDTVHDPNLQVNQLITRAVRDYGVVGIFMAGNAGGSGAQAMTTGQCQNPLEGIICVGGADDGDQGDRTKVTTYSATSRGALSNAATWPDLVAVATRIASAKPVSTPNLELSPSGQLQTVSSPYYQTLSGTSQATPMVAACVALMLQANGAVTPAQVERVLESTAYKYGTGYAVDSDPRYGGSHYAKGHGLLDCHAAIAAVRP